jgi:hypothetical protein
MMIINSVNTPTTVPQSIWDGILSDVEIFLKQDEVEVDARGDGDGEGVPGSRITSSSTNPAKNSPSKAVAKPDAGLRHVSNTARNDFVAPRGMKPIDFKTLFILDRCTLPGTPPSSPGSLCLSLNDTPSLVSDDSIYQSFSLFGSPLLSQRTLEDARPAHEDTSTSASAESFPNAEGSPSSSKELSGCERSTRVSKRRRYKVNPYDPTCLRRSQRLRLKAEERARKREHC